MQALAGWSWPAWIPRHIPQSRDREAQAFVCVLQVGLRAKHNSPVAGCRVSNVPPVRQRATNPRMKDTRAHPLVGRPPEPPSARTKSSLRTLPCVCFSGLARLPREPSTTAPRVWGQHRNPGSGMPCFPKGRRQGLNPECKFPKPQSLCVCCRSGQAGTGAEHDSPVAHWLGEGSMLSPRAQRAERAQRASWLARGASEQPEEVLWLNPKPQRPGAPPWVLALELHPRARCLTLSCGSGACCSERGQTTREQAKPCRLHSMIMSTCCTL